MKRRLAVSRGSVLREVRRLQRYLSHVMDQHSHGSIRHEQARGGLVSLELLEAKLVRQPIYVLGLRCARTNQQKQEVIDTVLSLESENEWFGFD